MPRLIAACCLAFATAFLLLPSSASAYSVQNGKIVDAQGLPVQLRGVNWFGFETEIHAPHGLWARNWRQMLSQMKTLGVNALRVPLCPATLDGVPVGGIDYDRNPDLRGLNSLELLDAYLTEADRQGFHLLLDHHRPDCSAISELWYKEGYRTDQWIADLVRIALRYRHLPHFLGIDLKNEPHGSATWGTGDEATDWNIAAARAASAVIAAAPQALVFVEGVSNNQPCSGHDGHWWGGNFEPLNCTPLQIPRDRLVLSPHVYGPDVWMQKYFESEDFPRNMPAIWERHFGQFLDQGYAVILGEFGGRYGNNGDPRDRIWQDSLVEYLISKGVDSAFYWSWNPNSGDTGGLLRDDWKAIWPGKLSLLKRLWSGGQLEDPVPLLAACSDGQDNDGDGKADLTDPGCTGMDDRDEFDPASPSTWLAIQQQELSNWGGGLCKDIAVTNNSAHPLRWTLPLIINGQLEQSWNASFQPAGKQYMVSGTTWNHTLAAGATARFGYCSRSPAQPKPSPGVEPPPPSENLITRVHIQSDWQAGYCAEVIIDNPGEAAVNWTVSLPIQGQIYAAWEAKHEQDGNLLRAEGLDHNSVIAAGAQQRFGFCANR